MSFPVSKFGDCRKVDQSSDMDLAHWTAQTAWYTWIPCQNAYREIMLGVRPVLGISSLAFIPPPQGGIPV